jgi:hypothetical protein
MYTLAGFEHGPCVALAGMVTTAPCHQKAAFKGGQEETLILCYMKKAFTFPVDMNT